MASIVFRRDYFNLNQEHNGQFADVVAPAQFPKTDLRFWNERWAKRVGLEGLTDADKVKHFAQFEPLESLSNATSDPTEQKTSLASRFLKTFGSKAETQAASNEMVKPLAMRYHGHQFQQYNPQIGDGRGFLFAQCEDLADHRLLDFGTKGSGQTPYSRSGDGRLTLKGAVREALATEMLEALGVYTSKTFSFFETGEELQRNDEPSPTRSAVLTRLSHGHIRFGTFQRLAQLGETKLIAALVDYCNRVYFPEVTGPVPFFAEVVKRSAALAASWMTAGFVHGVLNTDNMNVTGESFDYGPWRFLPHYDPNFTAAYFDQQGLYAYGRQPQSVYWNLGQLLTALTSIADGGAMKKELDRYPEYFQAALIKKFVERLGVQSSEKANADETLFMSAYKLMAETKAPYENLFFHWYGGPLRAGAANEAKYSTRSGREFTQLIQTYKPAIEAEARLHTEYFKRERPEAMYIDEVESIWSSIEMSDDWSRFNAKIESVRARGRVFGFGT